jgi:dephospho-CoA kinase
MKVIGLTGGIGSGKSTVAAILTELGAVVIDTDKLGHEAFKHGTEVWRQVVDTFGEAILDADGEIDRTRLAAIVFADAVCRVRLDSIMHPAIFEMVRAQVAELQQKGVAVVVVEVPLLFEGGSDWGPVVDEIWVTTAPEAAVLERLQTRSGMERADALARIHSQMPVEEKRRLADIVIENDGSLADLADRVRVQWRRLQAG